jgi:hypothetical protein
LIWASQATRTPLFGNINPIDRYDGLNAAHETNISEFFYAYYNRQYHESYGAGHDGNSPHRVAPVRSKKLPELARGMGRAVKEFGAARDEVEMELSQSGPNVVASPKLLDQKNELPSVR